MKQQIPPYYTDFVATAEITDPALVEAKVNSFGSTIVHKGAIFVTCPELGIDGTDNNLIYCRYGMSVPYFKVQVGDKVWIRPTIGEKERWIYTGFCDCGQRTGVDPATVANTQGLLIGEAGYFLIKMGNVEIEIKEDETITIKNNSGNIVMNPAGTVTINDNLEVIV